MGNPKKNTTSQAQKDASKDQGLAIGGLETRVSKLEKGLSQVQRQANKVGVVLDRLSG
jgi:hypothetical protein